MAKNVVPAEAHWGQSGLGFAVSGLPYGTLAEVPKSIEIVLGFAVFVLSPRVCAHFLEAQTKKSLFEIKVDFLEPIFHMI